MRKRDYKEGFTIVEVALVLAIAGLIFLMIFVALPAVQKTQRDAERRNDLGTLLTAIQKYQDNHRGALPNLTLSPSGPLEVTIANASSMGERTWGDFYLSYLGDSFTDPIAGNYELAVELCTATNSTACSGGVSGIENRQFDISEPKIYVEIGATCDGAVAIGSNNNRKVAVVYKMEGAGAYCANMQ